MIVFISILKLLLLYLSLICCRKKRTFKYSFLLLILLTFNLIISILFQFIISNSILDSLILDNKVIPIILFITYIEFIIILIYGLFYYLKFICKLNLSLKVFYIFIFIFLALLENLTIYLYKAFISIYN